MEIVLEFILFIITGIVVFGVLMLLGIVATARTANKCKIQPLKKSPRARERLDFVVYDDLDEDESCPHTETEERFDYLFTEEIKVTVCKICGERLTKTNNNFKIN